MRTSRLAPPPHAARLPQPPPSCIDHDAFHAAFRPF